MPRLLLPLPHARVALTAGLAAMLLPSASARAQERSALTARLDSIADSDVAAGRAVGYQVAIVRGTETLLHKAYGKADAEGGAPMTANTIVAIGSATKQFTAVAILQLRDAGKLGIDDEVVKWLPALQPHYRGVTLRHLLGHTGGVQELVEMQEVRALRLLRNPTVSRDSVLGIISRHPLLFEPGAMQMYSNTGYWLLGRVVERASGMSYEDYVEREIFAKLGMQRSRYCSNAAQDADRALGHGVRNGMTGRVPEIVHTATFAAGAICSTAGDLVTWLQALHGGKVLSPGSYAELTTPSRLADGTPTRYAMGLLVWDDARGLPEIGHSGGGFGYSSQVWWHPAERLAVAVLTNSEPDNTTRITEELTAAVLGPARAVQAFTGNAAELTGTYRGQGRGKPMVIAVTDSAGGLAMSIDGAAPRRLEWVEGWTFRPSFPRLVMFRRTGESGPATEVRLDEGGDYFVLRRER